MGLRRALFGRNRKTQTSCAVFCPNCKTNLCTQTDGLMSDDERGVQYECEVCGQQSRWHFDAPLPLLIEKIGDPRLPASAFEKAS